MWHTVFIFHRRTGTRNSRSTDATWQRSATLSLSIAAAFAKAIRSAWQAFFAFKARFTARRRKARKNAVTEKLSQVVGGGQYDARAAT